MRPDSELVVCCIENEGAKKLDLEQIVEDFAVQKTQTHR